VVPSGLTQVHVIRLGLPSTAHSPTLFSHPGSAEIQFVSQALSNTEAQVKPYCHHYTRRSEAGGAPCAVAGYTKGMTR